MTVDVPTTCNVWSGFVLPRPNEPPWVRDKISWLLCPYIHENLPVWIPVPLPAWMNELTEPAL